MAKTDFKKELKDFYSAKKDKIAVVKVPKMKFLAIDGKHHEIYLSDPRRAAPEKLKTIIREPVAKR